MSPTRAFPTVNSAGFAFILGVMWYVGMAQGNGVAYLLFFLLLGVLAVSVPKTYLNLAGIKIAAESPKPVFAGQEIALPIELFNQSKRTQCSISVSVSRGKSKPELVPEISPGQARRATLRFQSATRGLHEIPSITLETVFPLGFLRAWRTAEIGQRVVVYPKPAGTPKLPHSSSGAEAVAHALLPEGDDFAGVRPYQIGEAQRHIDWKAVARGHPLMSKQFAREEGGKLTLDFSSLANLSLEERLSQLALWIITAETSRRPYRLVLPHLEIPAGTGESHYHRCLSTLATYQ